MRSEPTKVPLRKPIQAHGEELTSLTLRRPTGRELRIVGVPLLFLAGGGVLMEPAAMAGMIGELASVPPSSLDQLVGSDYSALAIAVMKAISAAPTGPEPREPTGADLRRIGMPVVMRPDSTTGLHGPSMAMAIGALCAIDAEAVDDLDAPAWMCAALAVMGFFVAAPAAGSPPTNS